MGDLWDYSSGGGAVPGGGEEREACDSAETDPGL